MKIRFGSGLLYLNLLSGLLIAATFFPFSHALRVVIGVPFCLFFPGYSLVAALFPSKKAMGGIARVALGFGASVAVVALIGLALNYTVWGITLESMVYSITSFTLAMSVLAWIRRRLEKEERFDIEFQPQIPGWGGTVLNKILSVVLVISVLAALGVLGYAIARPKVGEKFTEFYVLGAGGKAADYPWELARGEVGKVMVGIVNHERHEVRYRVEIKVAGTLIGELEPVMLEHEQKWEREVDITPVMVGKSQKVEFLLFEEGQEKPSSLLHLWLDVKERR